MGQTEAARCFPGGVMQRELSKWSAKFAVVACAFCFWGGCDGQAARREVTPPGPGAEVAADAGTTGIPLVPCRSRKWRCTKR
jgi:hypothetical protein